ncbi:unnamed protein product [Amoebophrya sp. A120]|nr:unnamed protein product [Amoebophrya sp. A120]|eukprot:GSA120T00023717001.1
MQRLMTTWDEAHWQPLTAEAKGHKMLAAAEDEIEALAEEVGGIIIRGLTDQFLVFWQWFADAALHLFPVVGRLAALVRPVLRFFSDDLVLELLRTGIQFLGKLTAAEQKLEQAKLAVSTDDLSFFQKTKSFGTLLLQEVRGWAVKLFAQLDVIEILRLYRDKRYRAEKRWMRKDKSEGNGLITELLLPFAGVVNIIEDIVEDFGAHSCCDASHDFSRVNLDNVGHHNGEGFFDLSSMLEESTSNPPSRDDDQTLRVVATQQGETPPEVARELQFLRVVEDEHDQQGPRRGGTARLGGSTSSPEDHPRSSSSSSSAAASSDHQAGDGVVKLVFASSSKKFSARLFLYLMSITLQTYSPPLCCTPNELASLFATLFSG